MERLRAAHPKTRRAGFLPARFGHTRDEPVRGEFSERQARNLEPANERPAAAADFATIDHPGGAGIAGKLRQAHVIFLRLELSTQRRVFFHGRALAFVAIILFRLPAGDLVPERIVELGAQTYLPPPTCGDGRGFP